MSFEQFVRNAYGCECSSVARWLLGPGPMAVRDYRELHCWQLAEEVKRLLISATAGSSFAEYRWLRDQLLRSASSASANIAEGFARFGPKDFARFLTIARASMTETLVHLDTPLALDLIDAETFEACRSRLRRSRAATARLIEYLRAM